MFITTDLFLLQYFCAMFSYHQQAVTECQPEITHVLY